MLNDAMQPPEELKEEKAPHSLLDRLDNRLQRDVFHFVETTAFENFILGCIVLNIVTMGLIHWTPGPNPSFDNILDIANTVFLSIFTLEAVLKIYGLNFNQYNTSAWNKVGISQAAVWCDVCLTRR